MSSELINALETIQKEKKISKEEILHVIENALVSAYKKHVGKAVNVEAKVNPETGAMSACVIKKAVEEVSNPLLEVSLQDAKKLSKSVKIDEEIKIPLDTDDFSRIAAQTAKQVIVQKIRESERDSLYEEMKGKIGEMINGSIYKIANRNIIVDLGRTEAILPVSEQAPKETFSVGQHIRACVGVKGARIKPIIDELRGERIDLIPFSNDPVKYITAALSPAKVLTVAIISEEEKKAEVIVANDMLSLAIGKSGHNVRLAARLTGWHIDVKSEEQKKQETEQKLANKTSALEQLKGISDKTIELLVQAGFTNINKIAELKTEDLTTLPGIGEKTAEKIIEAAKEATK